MEWSVIIVALALSPTNGVFSASSARIAVCWCIISSSPKFSQSSSIDVGMDVAASESPLPSLFCILSYNKAFLNQTRKPSNFLIPDL